MLLKTQVCYIDAMSDVPLSPTYVPFPSATNGSDYLLYYTYQSRAAVENPTTYHTILGNVSLVVSVCLTPVAIVADLVVSVVDLLFILCRQEVHPSLLRVKAVEIRHLLYTKWIVSPLQQIASAIVKVVLGPVLMFYATSYPDGWILTYWISQSMSCFLPELLHAGQFDCFVSTDIKESFVENFPNLLNDLGVFLGNDDIISIFLKNDFSFETTIQNARKELKIDLYGTNEYNAFKERIFIYDTPWEIFGFSNPDGITKEEVDRIYKEFVLVLHPDQISDELKAEATTLFSCLSITNKELLKTATTTPASTKSNINNID